MAYFGCHMSVAGGYQALVKEAAAIGADTFQYFTRNPRGSRSKALDSADIDVAVELMRSLGFGPVVAHGSYTMNLCTADPENRAFAARILREDLSRVSQLTGAFYNFHPGSHVGQGVQTGISQIAAALEQALALELPVTVLLETMSGKGSEVGGRFQELRQILDAVPDRSRLGVCLDTCHVWDAGYDIAGNLDSVLAEFDQVVGFDRLRVLHINDSQNPLGSRKDRHARLGMGKIGADALEKIITHPALGHLPMILETPNDLAGHAREIALLRQWQSGAHAAAGI